MWKQQRAAHNKQQKPVRVERTAQTEEVNLLQALAKPAEPVVETAPYEFKLKELEETANVIRCELMARLDASYSINYNYQQLVDHCLTSLYSLSNYASKLIDDSAPVKEYRRRMLKSPTPCDLSKTMRMSDLESEHAASITHYKEIEATQFKMIGEMKNDLQQPVGRLRSSLEELFNIIKDQDQHIHELKHSIEEISVEHNQHIEAETERASEIITKLKVDQQKLKEYLEETKEAKEAEKQQLIEALKKEHEHAKSVKDGAIESERRAYEMDKVQLLKEKELLESTNKRLQKTVEDMRMQFGEEMEQMKKTHKTEFEALNASLHGEAETLKSIHSKKWAELSQILAAKEAELESHEQINRQLKEALRKTQGELKTSESSLKHAEEKLGAYMSQLPKYQQDTAEVIELRSHIGELRTNETQHLELIRHLQRVLGPVYDSHKIRHKDWNEKHRLETLERSWKGWAEVVLWADFCSHVIAKLSGDNVWLIDRITEFGRELERTKIRSTVSMPVQTSPARDDGVLKKVWRDVKSTASAFKEFEQARHRLVEKFKTSHL
mmetsp:Transcript_14141/g.26597  ORF Transcript_14141/g.26597 Transcript_14141/m.26597 type:complete len:554 (-) Transcript_14141:2313-3974(-)